MDEIIIVSGKRWLEILLLLVSDLLGFGVAIGFVAVARHVLLQIEYARVFDTPGIHTLQYLLIFLVVMLVTNGLYPGWKRSSVIELKQIIESITLAYVLTSGIIFIQSNLVDFSRSVFILSWFFSIIFIPIGRFLVRKLVTRYPWWGEPVVVIGPRQKVREVAQQLAGCSRLGLRPAIGLVLDGAPSGNGSPIQMLAWSQEKQEEIQKAGIQTSVLAISSSELRQDFPDIFRQLELSFNKTVFILSDDIFSFMMSEPLDVGGHPALISKQSLFDTASLPIKRLIDILFLVVFSIPILLVGCLLALWIGIDSPGPVIYTQERVGREGKLFRVYKFRTMYKNANEILVKMLKKRDRRAEWELYHKLDDDKRITRAGIWLRRLSLDELPQVINILKGEMSLVGPRPYLEEEVAQIGDAARIVHHVRPGITGWWQVMGRNNLSFQERIGLELYYVSNWSLWLDFFIIIKTVWVVWFLRDGK
jgi:Undecaprenyl-phosphate galactose phosphotransferase WbaP